VNAIEELLARDQIRQLAVRYALAVDGKDLDGIAALFAEDVSNGSYGSGRAGVRNFYDQAMRRFHCSMHLVANHVIDFDDDDHAHGVVYCRAHHHVLEPEHWFDKALAYWDTYERAGDDWFFQRRRLKSWYHQEFGHPEHGTERIVEASAASGPLRGAQMPTAFASFDAFWASPTQGHQRA
jgi:ketosteroid isomerase-like protein